MDGSHIQKSLLVDLELPSSDAFCLTVNLGRGLAQAGKPLAV